MSSKPASRWADDEEDARLEAQRKREKEEKRRLKAEKQRKLEEAARLEEERRKAAAAAEAEAQSQRDTTEDSARPAKRRRTSPSGDDGQTPAKPRLLRFPEQTWSKSRSVEDFEKLNDIDEGSYGWVSRAKDEKTGRVVALKRLKMQANEGTPITGLREIQTLLNCNHVNVVKLHEVVVGEDTTKIENIFLVLEFLEHDLRTLLLDMSEPFLPSETKTLLLQLASGLNYLHENWIMHRDLKTSNLLLSNRGILKIADFGMARYYSQAYTHYLTPLVITLWYRPPELLLGAKTYGPEIDMWSTGCIFAELLTREPIFQGNNEVGQLAKIFELCGIPDDTSWPGFRRLPNAKSLRLPPRSKAPQAHGAILRAKFPFLTKAGSTLLGGLLSMNPDGRPTAREMLAHPYFKEDPRPKSTALFPTFPSKAGLEKRRRKATPDAPQRGEAPGLNQTDFSGIFANRDEEVSGAGFELRLV